MTYVDRYQIPIEAADALTLRDALLDYIEQTHEGAVDRDALTRAMSASVDMVALVGEAAMRQGERVAGESNLASAVEPQSVLDLAYAAYNYVPPGAVAARYTCTVGVPGGSAVVIPAGTRVQTAASGLAAVQVFQVESEVVIPASSTSGTVTVRHGIASSTSTTASGAGGQIVEIPGINVDLDTVVVTVGGLEWTRVASFSGSTPVDYHYRIRAVENVAGDRRYQVVFGDGTLGRLPGVGLAINVAFVAGVGPAGNVAIGTINVLTDTLRNASNVPVAATVVSTAQVQRGRGFESADITRVKAPLSIALRSAVVSLADYEAAALAVAGGATRAKAYTSEDLPGFPVNSVLILAAVDLETALTTSEANAIAQAIRDGYATNGTARIVCSGAALEAMSLEVTVVLAPGRRVSEETAEIEGMVEDFFSLDAVSGPLPGFVVDIGKPIYLSSLVNFLKGNPAVGRVILPGSDGFDALTPAANALPVVTVALTVEAWRRE